VDLEKQMIFADLDVERGGRMLPQVHPAKFIYNESEMGPTTEVSQINGFRDDLYVVVGSIDVESKRATFRFHVNPLVAWIWIGVLVLIGGAAVSLWPDVSLKEVGAWSYVRASAGVASGVMFALILASSPAMAVQTDRDTAAAEAAAARKALALSRASVKRAGVSGSGDLATNAGLCILTGLLAGAALACSRRSRAPQAPSA
jgi:cytochrome c-type biogenesis protein CcmF